MPLAYSRSLSPTSTLAVWHLTETADELAAGLSHPELYAAKVANLKPESRRLREIVAARRLLKEASGTEWSVAYDNDGRPYATDHAAALSITHTEGHVAVLITAPTVRPGIDIERLGHRVARVAERFLMPEELRLLQAVEPRLPQALRAATAERPEADPLSLHLAWSAKETAYKVLGTTHYDLQHKTTLTAVHPDTHTIELRAEGVEQPLCIRYSLTADYVLTYCC